MRAAAAFAVLAIVPLLAGCAGDEAGPAAIPPVSPGLPAVALTEGGSYAFAHAGGSLVFTIDGSGDAAFELYDGEDRRVGSVEFTSGATQTGLHRIDGVPAGDLVLRVGTLNGTLLVESGGQPVARFTPLGRLVERIVLHAHAPEPLDGTGVAGVFGLQGNGQDFDLPVTLRRAPVDLRLIGAGHWNGLEVRVESERGLVLVLDDAEGTSSTVVAPGQERILQPLTSQLTAQNLRGADLLARVRADDLRGTLVLEAESYSRAPLPTPGQDSGEAAAFEYGSLPEGPVAFNVHQDATRLLLWQDGTNTTGNASVALFGPDDRRIANVLVPMRGVVAVPVSGPGEHVAVRLAGGVAMGADHAPAGFDLRPLEVQQTIAPAARAGDSGLYEVETEELDLPTAFAFIPAVLATPQGNLDSGGGPGAGFLGCSGGRFLRVDQGGESVLVSLEPSGPDEPDPAPFATAGLALANGPIAVTHDGFGDDGCDRPAVAIRSYVRRL